MGQDFLDAMIEESTRRNPEFPSLMEDARRRRALLDKLVAGCMSARIWVSALLGKMRSALSKFIESFFHGLVPFASRKGCDQSYLSHGG